MIKKRSVKLLTILLVVICCSSSLKAQNDLFPVLKLDINNSDNPDENEAGFTPFTLGDSGSQVDGITIVFEGDLDARWRDTPTGIPYELLYRDFLFARPAENVTVTISGLEADQAYEIRMYCWDTSSTGTRNADWTANGEFLFTTSFDGAQDAPMDEDDAEYIGMATADQSGRIVIEGVPGDLPYDGAPFAFINGLVLSSSNPIEIATSPSPEDKSIVQFTQGMLTWVSGASTVSHNVYFGEDFDDVNDGTVNSDTFIDNLSTTYIVVGYGYMPNDPAPNGLVPGTTYYWRIDELEADDTVHKGQVWSFKVASETVYNPIPANNAQFASVNVTLAWTADSNSTEHHVYFGDNFQDVLDGTGDTDKGMVTDPNYTPGLLEFEKIYYWRVDEVDGTDTYTGDVWSFTTTLPGLGTVVQEIWEGIAGYEVALLTADAGYPANPSQTDELTEFSTQPNMDTYGGRISGWLYVPLTGDYTLFLSTDNQGELWLSTNEEPENAQLVVSETSWGAFNNFSRKSEPIALIGGNKYYIMALWKEEDGGDHCQVAWEGAGIPVREIIQGNYISPYEPVTAFSPNPNDGAINVKNNPVLSWTGGKYAASHEVYFGTDEDAVRNATTASPEYIGSRTLGEESYEPDKLTWLSTYYWRVDAVNNIDPNSPWKGDVWSFTTGAFLVVDDFEDYNVTDKQIWAIWHDGFGYWDFDGVFHPGNNTGSGVGDEDNIESYMEHSIVNSGSKSMPYFFNNNDPTKMKYSEAKKTLIYPRDWTEEGVKALSLWFQGYPASVGSFTDNFDGTYTMTASGTDITGTFDEFHFAYKPLTGVGSIIARVDSMDNTDPWAKAGVMIRQTLDPNSAHAMVFVTPENGVVFEFRSAAGLENVGTAGQQAGITAPQWVKLERDLSGFFIAYYSSDGQNWTDVGIPENIPMGMSTFVGLAVTAHNADLTCQVEFSNVQHSVSGPWENQDIGILSNEPERMYVTIANSNGTTGTVYYEDNDSIDPNAALIDAWTQWNIDLKEFQDQGVNLADVNSIAIGFGTRGGTTPGGAGKMYFDDIRLYRPRYIHGKGTPIASDITTDGIVDYRDIQTMAGDWITSEYNGLL
ncbi:MAG: hypothetical protein ACYS80_16695, partial [Planctomycetota bacterium]